MDIDALITEIDEHIDNWIDKGDPELRPLMDTLQRAKDALLDMHTNQSENHHG